MTVYFKQWLHEEKIGEYAAEGGSLDVIRYLVTEGKAVNHAKLYRLAARHGHLPIIQYISSTFTRIIHHQYSNYATKNPSYYDEKHVPFYDPAIYIEAARGGHLSIIQWAQENHIPTNRRRGSIAKAKNMGYLIRRPRSKDISIGQLIGPVAAKYGHLNIISYLYENEEENSNRMIHNAAKNGHLHIIQYCVENYLYGLQIPTNSSTGEWAARNGHLSIIIYLKEQNRYQPYKDLTFAVKNHHWDVAVYLLENGFYKEEELNELCSYLGKIGNLSMIFYLEKRNLLIPKKALTSSFTHHQYTVYEYLLNKYTYNKEDYQEICALAIQRGYLSFLKEICEKFYSPNEDQLRFSLRYDRRSIIEYFSNKGLTI